MLGGVTVMLPVQLVLGSKYQQLHRARVREAPWKICSLQGGYTGVSLAWGCLPAGIWLIPDLCGHYTAGPHEDAHVKIPRSLFLSKAVQW